MYFNHNKYGVATEIYNQVVDILSTQCANLQGRFIEPHQIKVSQYNPKNYCEKTLDTNSNNDEANDIVAKTMDAYLIGDREDTDGELSHVVNAGLYLVKY